MIKSLASLGLLSLCGNGDLCNQHYILQGDSHCSASQETDEVLRWITEIALVDEQVKTN